MHINDEIKIFNETIEDLLKLVKEECTIITNESESFLDAKKQIRELIAFNTNESLTEEQEKEWIKLSNSGLLIDYYYLKRIYKHLKLKNIIEERDLSEEIKVFETICRYLNKESYIKREDFKKLIIIGKKIIQYNNCEYSNILHDPDIKRIETSYQYLLKKYNIRCFIELDNIVLEEESEKIICESLENEISKMGGKKFLTKFINDLNVLYDPDSKKYLIDRKIQMFSIPENRKEMRIPYNYLLELGVKNLDIFPKEQSNNFTKIINIAKFYFDLLDLRSYIMWSDTNISAKEMPYKIIKNIIFEKMFTINQCNPEYIIFLLNKLNDFIKREDFNRPYSLKEYLRVAEYFLRSEHSNITYSIQRIACATNIKTEKLKQIMDDISLKTFKTDEEFNKKPLIKLSTGEYYLVDSALWSQTFYDIAHEYCKKIGREKEGQLVEKFVYDLLKESKIDYCNGEYMENINGECDLVLQDEKKVVFMEIKKRALDSSIDIIDDIGFYKALSEGIVKALIQALKHQIRLKDHKSLKLKNKEGKEFNIEKNERNIYSMSISLKNDYFININPFTKNLLYVFCVSTFCANKPEAEKNLENFNEQIQKLKELTNNRSDKEDLFESIKSYSLEDLYFLVNKSKGRENLIDKLIKYSYMQIGDGNVYHTEYQLNKN